MISRSDREENGCVAVELRFFNEKLSGYLYNLDQYELYKTNRILIYDAGFTGTDL